MDVLFSTYDQAIISTMSRRYQHQHLVGGRAKSAENHPLELITEMLRGMRDTAGFEEEWGDETEDKLNHAMLNAGRLHDVKFTSLVSAY